MSRVWWALQWPSPVPFGEALVAPAAGGPVTVCPFRDGLSRREPPVPRSQFPGAAQGFSARWIQEHRGRTWDDPREQFWFQNPHGAGTGGRWASLLGFPLLSP